MQHFNIMRPVAVCAAILIAIFPAGCATTAEDIVRAFSGIRQSTDPTYGYTLENPVLIGQFGYEANFAASSYFMAGLRKNGRPLYILSRGSTYVEKHMIDMWSVVPEGTTDTMTIYVDVYRSSTIRVPQGLTFLRPPVTTGRP